MIGIEIVESETEGAWGGLSMTIAGVITVYTVKVDPGRVGRAVDALLDVRLLPSTDPDQFERLVANLPAVTEIVLLTGRFHYQLRVACKDAEDLDQTVRAVRRGGGVAATETRIVMRSASFEQEGWDEPRPARPFVTMTPIGR